MNVLHFFLLLHFFCRLSFVGQVLIRNHLVGTFGHHGSYLKCLMHFADANHHRSLIDPFNLKIIKWQEKLLLKSKCPFCFPCFLTHSKVEGKTAVEIKVFLLFPKWPKVIWETKGTLRFQQQLYWFQSTVIRRFYILYHCSTISKLWKGFRQGCIFHMRR